MTRSSHTPFFRRRHVRRFALWAGLPVFAAGALLGSRALASPPLGAWHGHHGHHGPMHADSAEDMREHMQHRLDRMLDRLEADESQRVEVERIVGEAAPELFALAQQGRDLRLQLTQALTAPEVDQGRVQTLAAEIEATISLATRVGVETLGQLSTVLNPDQRQQVADFFARFEH